MAGSPQSGRADRKVTQRDAGITAISSFSGDFANVTIAGNSFAGCKVNLDLGEAGPGISVTR